VEKGGWWDPIYPDSPSNRIFKTQSGRFEFFSRRLQQEVEGMMAAAPITPAGRQELQRRWKTEASGDLLYLPHLELPRFGKEGADYPYHLLSYPLLTTRCGVGANLPLLQELFGMHTREYWNSWVEINPETAKQLGIQDGELVNIIFSEGEVAGESQNPADCHAGGGDDSFRSGASETWRANRKHWRQSA